MIPLKVNADYEIQLFEKRAAPDIINQSLEFLALYLEEAPLSSIKKYADEFLDHVESITGKRPVITKEISSVNWWGDLKNLSLETRLNSKEFTAAFSPESLVVTSLDEIRTEADKIYLAKNPFGMSGQNLIIFRKGEESKLSPLLEKTGKLVIEPLYERVHDFSHYVFPDGGMISYENIVDKNFQYKGTIFNNLKEPSVESLSFYKDVSSEEWEGFHKHLHLIIDEVRQAGGESGFSVDSFTYHSREGLKLRCACELNYRKTMGMMAWMLSQKYSKKNSSLFILGKSLKRKDAFSYIQKMVKEIPDCLYLSPGDTRFDMFLISGDTREDVLMKAQKLKTLLPHAQLAV